LGNVQGYYLRVLWAFLGGRNYNVKVWLEKEGRVGGTEKPHSGKGVQVAYRSSDAKKKDRRGRIHSKGEIEAQRGGGRGESRKPN